MRYRILFLIATVCARAQEHQHGQEHEHKMSMNAAGMYLMDMASGTSMNPMSAPMPMVMPRVGMWSLMLMGDAFVVGTQQSGPRGGDKVYSTNSLMLSASHDVGRGSFLLESMISLEPATVTERRYPLLFQTGETAYGRPLVDAQHPHNFLMAVGVQYARPVAPYTMLQLSYAPVGDPALGPVAFPHRASAMELPQAPLGHHWQDSTHIAANVATVAVKYQWVRLEASGFHGREPGEGRWGVDYWGAMDSYGGRLSALPTKNWMFQVSAGRLASPEGPQHGDVVRTTASAHYSRPMAGGGVWSTSLIWGRNHETISRRDLHAVLAETVVPIGSRNFVTGRAEWVDKDELFVNEAASRLEGIAFVIGAYTAGYTRNVATFRDVEAGIGVNATVYDAPEGVKPYYGDRPWGVNVFLRLRLKGAGKM